MNDISQDDPLRASTLLTEPNPLHVFQDNPLRARTSLTEPRPLRICFPVLLDGDLVMSSEHLGVSYLTSTMRLAGAKCKITEVRATNGGDAAAIQEIVEWRPDIVGMSLTTVTVSHATEFGHSLRESLGDDVYFLAGGPLATFLDKELITNPAWRFLDGLVRGDGDIPLIRFAETWWNKGKLADVPNLTWRDGEGRIHINTMAPPLADLDMLPEPARDQFEQNNRRLPYLRLATTRGCTSRCTFCNAPHAGNKIQPGKLWRARTPKLIVDEIERLYHKYRFNTFDFVDSTFEDPGGVPFAKERVRNIAEEIIKRGLRIYYNVCMQAKNWSEADKDLIDILYRSGLEKVLIGVESGSSIGLNWWKKKSTVDDNKRAIQLLWDAGIYVAFGFIAFHPWSTFGEIRENNRFLRDMMGHNLRRFTVRLELYPGAEVISTLRDDGMLEGAFDSTLNPLAYRFHDPRVERLSDACALLYGDRYRDEGVIEKEPAVFEFETYDVVLHTYISRLRRHFLDHAIASEIISQTDQEAEQIRNSMSAFNFDLVSDLVDRTENETLSDDYVRSLRLRVEEFFAARIKEFKSLQLQTSMKLHREGLSIKGIQFS